MQPAPLRVVTAGEAATPPVLDLPPSRPRARAWRYFKAYWTTFVVIASYLSLRLTSKIRTQQSIDRVLLEKHKKNAKRIEQAILSLQGLFIKVGQLISIMTNFLPQEFRQELEGLQDQVPPRPFADVERRILDELGARPHDLFAEFEERPIAAASIGQVHVARLRTGEKVAVKVQYPDIDRIALADLRMLRRILSIVGTFMPFQGLDGVFEEIQGMVLAELDFRGEAENAKRIGANFAGRPDVAFPRIVDAFTTSRVLTTQWEEGIKIGDVQRLDKAGFDRKALARAVIEAYCQQIFVDGVYHADPHPGNLIVRRQAGGEPCLVFLDFGATAGVNAVMREGMIEFLQGAVHQDTQKIIAAMKKMGFIPRGADAQVLDRVIEHFHQRFQEEIHLESFSLRDVKFDPDKMFQNLADLRRMDVSLRELTSSFFVPKEWFLLERTLLLLMGLCTALDPSLNPMTVIRPYLERFVLGEEQDWSQFVMTTTKDLALSAVALPGEMRRFLGAAQRGQLEVSFRNVDDAARLMYRLGHQVIWAGIGLTAAAIAVVLGGRNDVHERIAWYVAAGAGTVFLLSTWSTRAWLRKQKRSSRR